MFTRPFLMASGLLMTAACATAHDAPTAPPPPSLQVSTPLPALPGVADLKFREFYAMPIGPQGLVPTPKLLALDGQRVRIVGHMAQQEQPSPGVWIATPLPVALGNEDESLADDLPATLLYVHLAPAQAALTLPHMPGLLCMTGVLHVGARREPDGRLSFVRLELDAELSRALSKGQTP